MSVWTLIPIALVAIAVAAWVGRFVGRRASGNAPRFRDMPYAVAFGYAFVLALLAWAVWYYLQPAITEAGTPAPGVTFFRWGVNALIVFAIAACLFRLLGRHVGTAGTRKLFRQMPLTAAFGLLVVLIYAILAIFAPLIAPYGQAEVFDQVNALPGGNAATVETRRTRWAPTRSAATC